MAANDRTATSRNNDRRNDMADLMVAGSLRDPKPITNPLEHDVDATLTSASHHGVTRLLYYLVWNSLLSTTSWSSVRMPPPFFSVAVTIAPISSRSLNSRSRPVA